MRFEKILPGAVLRPYIKYYVLSENSVAADYKVFPSSGMVIGFQYRGRLDVVDGSNPTPLSTAGITGMGDHYKVFRNSDNIGTLLVFFSETGFAHFSKNPANELFNQSISLDYIFSRNQVTETEERLLSAQNDFERIKVIERFLLSQFKDISQDRMVVEAVRLIYQSNGILRMTDLTQKLFVSQSAFEKRFRKLVGASPKKFAAIVRFNAVLGDLKGAKSLIELCYDHGFFDQAHFIKDFKKFTGDTPDQYKRLM